MKTLTALSAAALIAMAVPAFAQSSETTTKPNGSAGSTSGTDSKNGGTAGMSEGRSSVTDPNNTAGPRDNAMKNGTSGTNGATNNNMAPGGGPGDAGGASK